MIRSYTKNPEHATNAAEALEDTVVVRGRATDQALLEEEEIERCSAFVSVSTDFENNLVAGLLARRLGAERAFAVVDNPDLVHLIGEISIDAIISPRLLAVSLALQHVRGGGVRSVAALLEHEIEEQPGLRLMTNIVNCPRGSVRIGMAVRVVS